ncbi:MMPL family transporter [Caenispirillum salinarum]|uniref:MMPL family transporter n=1 Tax=Caenispirillum salinarum TaxID=859058 RepID=UPI001360B26A|nr:MMPL family transporter [Caenispirillum salinarum]
MNIADRYRRFMIHLVRACCRARWAVVAAAVAFTVVSAWFVASNLAVNSETEDMLDPALPFRQQAKELRAAFPELSRTLLVVVEGETPELVEQAAGRLAEAMSRDTVFDTVFYPAADPFFRRHGLLYRDVEALEDTVDRLTEAQPFLGPLWQDPSLRGLAGLLGMMADNPERLTDDAAAQLDDILTRMAAVAEARAGDDPTAVLSWRGVLGGGGAAGGEAATSGEVDAQPPVATAPVRRIIVAQPEVDYTGLAPGATAIRTLERLTDRLDLAAEYGVTVHRTGPVALAYDELQSVRTGMGLSGLISLGLVAVLLWFGVKSVRMVISALLTLVMGLIWTTAVGLFVVGSLNLISVAFAVLFIGLSVDFGIHFSLRYKEGRDHGRTHAQALDEAAGDVGDSLTLSAIAAAIGFFAFLPTSYVGLAELGLISGMGMGIALLANLTVLPALISIMHPRRIRLPRGPSARLVRTLENHPKSIVGTAAALALVSAVLAPFVSFDFDPLNLKDPEAPSVQALDDLMEAGDVNFYAAQVLAEDQAAAEALAERLGGLETVQEATTIAASVPTEQEDKLYLVDEAALVLGAAFAADRRPQPEGADLGQAVSDLRQTLDRLADGAVERPQISEAARRLHAVLGELPPEEAEAALMRTLPKVLDDLNMALEAQPVALEDLPAAVTTRWLSQTGRARVEVVPAVDVHDRSALADFVGEVRSVAPAVTGPPVTILEAGRTVLWSLFEAMAISAAATVLLLLVVLRSVRGIVYVFAPLGLATLMTAAVSVVIGLPLNFANVIVLPLLFGLGVASAIHIVQRARATGRASELLHTSTPRAVVYSTLTTIGSFASLALSDHAGTASMGILLTVAVGLTLLCTLVVLPALMAVAPLRRRWDVHIGE